MKSNDIVDLGMVEYGDEKVEKSFFNIQAYPVDGNFVGVVFSNITKQLEAESRLKIKIKEVEENAREMEQITYIASHDLQEPLTTIKSMVEWLRNKYEDKLDTQGKKGVNFIIQSVSRMTMLVKDLMDFSKIGLELQESKEVDTQVLIEEVISDLSASIELATATIEVDDLPVINGFCTDLRLLFQNLISNALKFRQEELPCKIKIEAKELEKYWQFCISDNGIGIDEKYLTKIFSIFKRLHGKQEYEGTGIGLAHCKKVVERHEGKIWVESERETGSSFYFTLAKKLLR